MILRSVFAFVFASVMIVLLIFQTEHLVAQNRDQPAGTQTPLSATGDSSSAPVSNRPEALHALSDFHLATWVILENEAQNRISQLAQQQAQTPEVRQFAQRMVQFRNQLNGRLLRVIRVTEGSNPGSSQETSIDVNAILDELAGQIESRSDLNAPLNSAAPGSDPSGVPNDPGLPYSTPPAPNSPPPIATPADTSINPDTRPATADSDRGSDRRSDGILRRREDARETRRDRLTDRLGRLGLRRNAEDPSAPGDGRVRDMVRDALPVIRQNLPEILDVLGEAVEGTDGDDTSLAFIQLQRETVNHLAARISDEIQRRPEDFDPAYLGYEIVAHDRLLSTIEVAKASASPPLRMALEQQVPALNEQIREARRLMQPEK